MKFTAAFSLCVAPLALAKAVHNVYPDRREVRRSSASSADILLAQEVKAAKGSQSLLEEVIIIWFNNGGGSQTTTVNPPMATTTEVALDTVTTMATKTLISGASTTVAATGTTHSVTVGGAAGLVYSPDTINAAIGDMVVFTFMSQNHTVSQSAFTTPCIALEGGMDSGFQPNLNNSVNPPPQVAMQVMVSTPLWFYCRQMGHCGKGMTFSINPTANKTQAMFQSMAIAQNGTGTGSAITGNGGTSTNSSSATTTTVGSLSATTLSSSSGSPGSLTTGTGTIGTGGSCECAVVCAVGSFPNIQVQGVGNFGGMAGSLPAANAMVV